MAKNWPPWLTPLAPALCRPLLPWPPRLCPDTRDGPESASGVRVMAERDGVRFPPSHLD